MSTAPGTVYLVGAGPGDPALITVRGQRLLERADVVVHDRLISSELLACARADAEIIDVRRRFGRGKEAQRKINATLIDRARLGRSVVRLKGGDPFVFGRGWEEWRACRDAELPCRVVPGVTSAIGVPATVGIPVTHRGTARSLAVVTARTGTGQDAEELNYRALADIDTVVILMGRSNLASLTRSLVAAGRDPTTPAACIERGTTTGLRSVVATLSTVADAADRERLEAPVVTVVGEVAACADEYRDYLEALSLPSVEHDGPLAGKRVVITRSSASQHELVERLSAAGAVTIKAPVVRVEYPSESAVLDEALGRLDSYDWIAFASVHAVRGFFERLTALGRDARALAPCRVGAIGPITAAALGERGIRPEVAPRPHSAVALAENLLKELAGRPGRVLCPGGDAAGSELPEALRHSGVTVDEVAAYHIVQVTPPDSMIEDINRGVDAVLFCSPASAVSFARLGLDIAGAAVACMGPSTAAAARQAGLNVDLVADPHADQGLVAALAQYFAPVQGRV